jgi:hypothetical protein
MIVKLNQEQELWLELTLSSNCCGCNSQPRQDNDMMNSELKSMSLDQGYEYQEQD